MGPDPRPALRPRSRACATNEVVQRRLRLVAGFPTVARAVAVGLFLAVALFSVTNTYRFDWEVWREDRVAFEGLTPEERVHAPGDHIPLRMDVFDFYRDRLRPGDRYFFQVQSGTFGAVDKPTAVRTFGRFYLLPAVLVDDALRATVILSWDTDPRALGLPYTHLDEAGRQIIFVARIDRARLGLP